VTTGSPTEVNFHPGQYLTARLFQAEQEYHVTMRERHNLSGHDWGVADGLQLSGGCVGSGYAVDGYGRELVLPTRTQLPLSTAFDEHGTDSLDVSLVYGRTVDATGDYVVEQPVVAFTPALGSGADRRHPPQVPTVDQDFDATGTAPLDNTHPWPVYLGTLTRDPGSPDKPPVLSGTPVYIAARAAQVVTPAGDAHLDLGADIAVYAASSDHPALHWQRTDTEAGARLDVAGALTVAGDLTVGGGRLILSGPADDSNPGWFLDHFTDTTDGSTTEQLRLVLGAPATADASTELVIGCYTGTQFTPCLTVAADGTVTVHGNLIIEGTMSGTPSSGTMLT
jgi:hypothetical protein